jgi:hypothetical protein
MKPLLNDILMLIYKDGAQRIYTVPFGKKAETAFESIKQTEKLDVSDLAGFHFFSRTKYTPEQYARYWDEESKSLDETAMAIDHKLEEVRKQRSILLQKLDLEFMKSMEEDTYESNETKQHIIDIKNYLRDLPSLLSAYLPEMGIEDIVAFNSYNNIFRIELDEGGSGYSTPPTVEISLPDGRYPGFPAKAIALIKDGSVQSIEMTQMGSSYVLEPVVTISPPDDSDGIQAEAFASPPENDIYDNISHLEYRDGKKVE